MSDNDNKKSWFARHKVLSAVLGFVLLIGVMGAAGGDSETSNSSAGGSGKAASGNAAKEFRFADRADKQAKDVEVLPGEAATVGDVKMTLSNVEYKTAVSEFEKAPDGKTYLIATVTLENMSDRTKPYNTFDFRVQTAGGQVLDGTFASTTTPLNSGDMVAGGKAEGQIVFEVPVEEGHQYVIWKPGFSSDRAIVQVK